MSVSLMSILMPVTPIYGHVVPMLAIGRGLVGRGHRVSVLTGRKYRSLVESGGMRFCPLPAAADFDDADLDRWLPGRQRSGRLAAGRYDIIGIFVRPLRAQHDAVAAEVSRQPYDSLVCDAAFMGVLPMLLTAPASRRIPIVGVSATPLSMVSVDCAPFGSGMRPGNSSIMRLRNRQVNTVLHLGPLRPIQRAVDAALAPFGVPEGTVNYFDHAVLFDELFQLAPREIEYPRREMPSSVRFVGPLRPDPTAGGGLPSWWGDLDGSRPVVHVTQGTMDNVDLGKLLVPALHALRDEDVLVVAATGGRPQSQLIELLGAPLPPNARVAEFLPYEQLLPRTDLMITNGGYGGVQQALRHGVPLVVAGATEDKPEVAARVEWSGVGVNLRTGRPSPRRVRRAVRAVLRERRYQAQASKLQRCISRLDDPVSTIVATVEAGGRRAPVWSSIDRQDL